MMEESETLIFLNGNIPGKQIINHFLDPEKFIICADGGANRILRFRIKPDIIIGDMDSAKKETLNYFNKKGTKIIKIEEQETTDFEKSLNYCLKNNLTNCVIFGAISTRPDHTLNNFSIMKRYYKKLKMKLIDNKFEIEFLRKSFTFNYKINNIISFLGFPLAEGITTNGLKYPLRNEALEFGVREGTLNTSVSDKITIKFRKGNLLLFRKHFII
jgi:thiamine pyrophosphokinase